ncbi:MAG: PAS domain-containing protein, partial [Cytophagales bacterium]|nr:PAS domain-containing protein [Cytophagales bacterium]
MSSTGQDSQRDRAARLASRHWPGLAGLVAVVYLASLVGLVQWDGFAPPLFVGWLAGAVTTAGLLYLLRQLAPAPRADTERLSAQALREAEQQYQDLAESIADIFYALDREMRFTYWNKACERFRGLPAAEVLGRHMHEIFPLTPDTGVDHAIRQALTTGVPGSTVNRYTAGGVEYYFDVSAYPTRHGVAVFGKDVTAAKRIEAELQEYTRQLTASVEALAAGEHKLRTVLDAMLSHVALFSPDGHLLDCN